MNWWSRPPKACHISHGGERFAELGSQIGSCLSHGLQHFFFRSGIGACLGKGGATGAIDGLHGDRILAAQRRDRAGKHGFGAVALANFAGDIAAQESVGRSIHHPQGLLHLFVGEEAQERGLLQGNGQRAFQRLVENGIAGGVGEVGENDGVFVGELGGAMGAPVGPPGIGRRREGGWRDEFPGSWRDCARALRAGLQARRFCFAVDGRGDWRTMERRLANLRRRAQSADRPESVSRLKRSNSARMSEAC